MARRHAIIISFNPRSPRGGATGMSGNITVIPGVSIHAPHEGERHHHEQQQFLLHCFNPRSPRGGATSAHHGQKHDKSVSIHAPHEGERRQPRGRNNRKYKRFNPRSPRGGATLPPSMHIAASTCFNPRSPRGGATDLLVDGGKIAKFQSTLPTRGSDFCTEDNTMTKKVSIHAPHEGERRRGEGI